VVKAYILILCHPLLGGLEQKLSRHQYDFTDLVAVFHVSFVITGDQPAQITGFPPRIPLSPWPVLSRCVQVKWNGKSLSINNMAV